MCFPGCCCTLKGGNRVGIGRKYGKAMRLLVLLLAIAAVGRTVTVYASASAGARQETIRTSDGDLEETFRKILDFIKEKWENGDISSAEDIKEVIGEAEEQFGLSLDEETKEKLARELYEQYGDGLLENAGEILKEQLAGPLGDAVKEQLAEPLQEAVKEQVVEPAKEAVKSAVKETAAGFWKDLTDSVSSFFKKLFS